jgi:hypothetical protein
VGIRLFRVWLLWLRGFERDAGVEQLESATLVAGGFGEHGDFGVGACVADLVAGEGRVGVRR